MTCNDKMTCEKTVCLSSPKKSWIIRNASYQDKNSDLSLCFSLYKIAQKYDAILKHFKWSYTENSKKTELNSSNNPCAIGVFTKPKVESHKIPTTLSFDKTKAFEDLDFFEIIDDFLSAHDDEQGLLSCTFSGTYKGRPIRVREDEKQIIYKFSDIRELLQATLADYPATGKPTFECSIYSNGKVIKTQNQLSDSNNPTCKVTFTNLASFSEEEYFKKFPGLKKLIEKEIKDSFQESGIKATGTLGKSTFSLDLSKYKPDDLGLRLPCGKLLPQDYGDDYYFWQTIPIDTDTKKINVKDGNKNPFITFRKDSKFYHAEIYIAKIQNRTGCLQLTFNDIKEKKFLYPEKRLFDNSTCEIEILKDSLGSGVDMAYCKVTLKIRNKHLDKATNVSNKSINLAKLFDPIKGLGITTGYKYETKRSADYSYNLSIDFGTSAMVVATSNTEKTKIIKLIDDDITDLYEDTNKLAPVIFKITTEKNQLKLTPLVEKDTINKLTADDTLRNLKNYLRYDLPLKGRSIENDILLKTAYESLLSKRTGDSKKADLRSIGDENYERVNAILFAVPNTQVSSGMKKSHETITKYLMEEYKFDLKDQNRIQAIPESDAVLAHFIRVNRDEIRDVNKIIIMDIGAGTTDITIAENLENSKNYFSLFKSCTISTNYAGNYFDFLIAGFLYSVKEGLAAHFKDKIGEQSPEQYCSSENDGINESGDEKAYQVKLRNLAIESKKAGTLMVKNETPQNETPPNGILFGKDDKINLSDLLVYYHCYYKDKDKDKDKDKYKKIYNLLKKGLGIENKDENTEKNNVDIGNAVESLIEKIKNVTTVQLDKAIKLSINNANKFEQANAKKFQQSMPQNNDEKRIVVLSGRGAKWDIIKHIIKDYCKSNSLGQYGNLSEEKDNNLGQYGNLSEEKDNQFDAKLAVVRGVAEFTNWSLTHNDEKDSFYKNTFPLLNYYMFVMDQQIPREIIPLYTTDTDMNQSDHTETANKRLITLNRDRYFYRFIISPDPLPLSQVQNDEAQTQDVYDKIQKLQVVDVQGNISDLMFGENEQCNHLYGKCDNRDISIFPPDKIISKEQITVDFRQSHWPQIITL